MRHASLAGLSLAAVLASGCLVEIEKVSDPGAAFARAHAEASRLQGQPGRPGSLEVLVYDREDRTLVRASLPMWVVRRAGEGDDIDLEFDDDDAEGRAARKLERHLRLEDVEKAGRGILVEAEEEDGDRVLVWLR